MTDLTERLKKSDEGIWLWMPALNDFVRPATEEEVELVERLEQAERDKQRAVYIAEHLFQMVPRAVWRDSGGDDMQGHYEGDYHAEQVQDELKALAAQQREVEGG